MSDSKYSVNLASQSQLLLDPSIRLTALLVNLPRASLRRAESQAVGIACMAVLLGQGTSYRFGQTAQPLSPGEFFAQASTSDFGFRFAKWATLVLKGARASSHGSGPGLLCFATAPQCLSTAAFLHDCTGKPHYSSNMLAPQRKKVTRPTTRVSLGSLQLPVPDGQRKCEKRSQAKCTRLTEPYHWPQSLELK